MGKLINKQRHLLSREGFDDDVLDENNVSLSDLQKQLLEMSSLAAELEMKDNISAAKKHYQLAIDLWKLADLYKTRAREIKSFVSVNKPTGSYRGNAEALKKYREEQKQKKK